MQFVSFCESFPVIDVLPVFKSHYFDSEIKQLFYARTAYVMDEGFFFDLMKFERDPIVLNRNLMSDDDSIVAISFNFSNELDKPTLSVKLNSTGKNVVFIDDECQKNCLSDIFFYKGSDEQGWYWGVRFTISKPLIHGIYGNISFKPESVINGNIYASLNNSQNAHFSSVVPFVKPCVLSKENHNPFTLTL